MRRFYVRPGETIKLGREGENKARQWVFDFSRWVDTFGEGAVQLVVRHPGECQPYPVPLEIEGEDAVWTVTNIDTSVVGTGKAEYQYYVGETLEKSAVFTTSIVDALGEPSDTPPDAYEHYMEAMLEVASRAEVAKAAAETAADKAATAAMRQPVIKSGTWWLWDFEKGEYVDSGVSVRPEDAVLFVPQEKSEDEKAQARANIGAVKSWDDLTDKPFGEETGVVEVLPETTLQVNVDEGDNGVIIPDVLDVNVGDKCVVTYNGIEYECEAQPFETEGFVIITLGDAGAVTGGEISGKYPFAIMVYPATIASMYGAGATVIPLDGAVSMTISIKKDGTIIHPIEGKYLPKGTPWIEEGEMVEVLPETTLEVNEEMGGALIFDVLDVSVGDQCVINYNGTEFTCEAQLFEMEGITCAALGDIGAMSGESTGSYPFLILVLPSDMAAEMGAGTQVLPLDGSATFSLSIKKGSDTIHKLDNRCLPDGIGGGVFNVYFTIDSDGNATTNQTYEEVFAKASDPNVATRAVISKDAGSIFAPLVMTEGDIDAGMMLFAAAYSFGAVTTETIIWSSAGSITYNKLTAS